MRRAANVPELVALLAQRSRKRRHSEILPGVLTVYLGYRVYGVDVADKHFTAQIESANFDDFVAEFGGRDDGLRHMPGLCGVRVRFEP